MPRYDENDDHDNDDDKVVDDLICFECGAGLIDLS